jgi:hypothetical protein
MSSYGFIITRHVNSEKTNKYWNHAVRSIRRFYPFRKIVIIDDNSNQAFVRADYEYKNIQIVQSEYPGRGELLPYYYFHKNKYFNNAVILHDSVFFHKRIHFEKFKQERIIPLWHFDYNENMGNCMRLSKYLNNAYAIQKKKLYLMIICSRLSLLIFGMDVLECKVILTTIFSLVYNKSITFSDC